MGRRDARHCGQAWIARPLGSTWRWRSSPRSSLSPDSCNGVPPSYVVLDVTRRSRTDGRRDRTPSRRSRFSLLKSSPAIPTIHSPTHSGGRRSRPAGSSNLASELAERPGTCSEAEILQAGHEPARSRKRVGCGGSVVPRTRRQGGAQESPGQIPTSPKVR
jgi:hypothetical protein